MTTENRPKIPNRKPEIILTDRDKIILNHVFDLIREDFSIRYTQRFREVKREGYFLFTSHKPNITIKGSINKGELTLHMMVRMYSKDGERQLSTNIYNINKNHEEKAQLIYQQFQRQVSDTSIVEDMRGE